MSTMPAKTNTTVGVGVGPGASSATSRAELPMSFLSSAAWSGFGSATASSGAIEASTASPPTISAVAAARASRSSSSRVMMRVAMSLLLPRSRHSGSWKQSRARPPGRLSRLRHSRCRLADGSAGSAAPWPPPDGVRSPADVDLHHRAAVLARTELFQGIDEATQRRIAGHVAERVVERGQCVFIQGEPGDRMYVLAEGAVKLYVSSRDGGIVELVRHRPPAAFGEGALLDGGPRTASAQAVERSVLLVMTRAELVALLRSDHRLAEGL